CGPWFRFPYTGFDCVDSLPAPCFFFQAEDGIRVFHVTGVQTCALPIYIPDPLLLPYFNLVPWDAIELDPTLAGALNAAFAGFNAALDGLVANGLISADDAAIRKVSYKAGVNPILIVDEDLEDLGPYFDGLLGM